MTDKMCYCEYIDMYFPNQVLIAVPKDKKEEILRLIKNYLGHPQYNIINNKENINDTLENKKLV